MNTIGRYRFIVVMKDNISLESDKMVYSVQQIKYEILAYIKEFGGEFSDYYVGVSNDPKKSLFGILSSRKKLLDSNISKDDKVQQRKQARV